MFIILSQVLTSVPNIYYGFNDTLINRKNEHILRAEKDQIISLERLVNKNMKNF